MNQVKLIVVIAMCVIACALCVFLAIYTSKASKALANDKTGIASKVISIIRYIVVAIAALAGAVLSGTALTGCRASRSITVQGTVVHQANPDSTRIIISSQESYVGVKK
jgi:hypothetical protein